MASAGEEGLGITVGVIPGSTRSRLCYGWIDGQKRPENEQSWLQRFLARSSKSIWSKLNREKCRAVASGEMRAAGLEAIEQAKKNGRWEAAYDSPSGATVPSDFSLRWTRIRGPQRFSRRLTGRTAMRSSGEFKR